MQYIRSPVSTVCIGQAASMGSLLLCAGAKGKRFALPNARIMVHQPSGGAQGQAADIEIQAREILLLRAKLNEIYVRHTGQPLEAIEAKLERDSYMSARGGARFRSGRPGGRKPSHRRATPTARADPRPARSPTGWRGYGGGACDHGACNRGGGTTHRAASLRVVSD